MWLHTHVATVRYVCRVIQKANETLDREQRVQLISELQGHVLKVAFFSLFLFFLSLFFFSLNEIPFTMAVRDGPARKPCGAKVH